MRGIMGRSMDGEKQQNQTTDDSEIPQEISDNTQLPQETPKRVSAHEKVPPEYQMGEHVIAFWLEGNEAKWHLGVVEGLKNGIQVRVQYLESVRIRCNIIVNELIQEMNTAVKNN